ncbi:hypothetical protein EAF40_17060 [Escherichia coli]|nr:hypothetical protein [Escherichia coli]EFN8720246.1 hypothetical protein [Escherichia coli]
MGKIAGKIFFTSKKHHSNQSPAAPSRCLQGHQIPFKRNLPSPRQRWVWQHICLISTHFYCNRLKSQHCQKALMTKQPWAGRCNHHTES